MSDASYIDKSPVEDNARVGKTHHDFDSFEKNNVDEALEIFNEVEQNGEVLIAIDDNKLRWKIDLHVLPLM
jgi:hypothetical protein